MLEPIVDLLRASRRVSASRRPGSALRALGEHEEILRRVEVGDVEGARRETRAHLANTAKDIEAVLGKEVLYTQPREREEL
jgi:DNA-binding GntR family transcriptional regulator